MDTNQKLSICLWFDNQAEEAMNLYCSIFKNSKKGQVSRYGPNMPLPEGTVLVANFTINNIDIMALNGGPVFRPNEAVSIVVTCNGQEEVDYYWNALTADGGQESQCGWLKDKYGFSWQIVPVQMAQIMSGPDKAGVGRAMGAMMQMKKLDVATLEKAYRGE